MYNLRFYLDDNDTVVKCDYRRLPDEDNIDFTFYNEIIQSKDDLYKAFNILAKHDLNHKYTIQTKYILHEFVVPTEIIMSMHETMSKFKEEQAKKRVEYTKIKKISETKFVGNKPKKEDIESRQQDRKRKYEIRRKNKYRRKKVATTITTLVALSAILLGGVKMAQAIKDKKDIVQEPQEIVMMSDDIKDNIITDEIDINSLVESAKSQESEEMPNMSGMIEEIHQTIEENNFDYSLDIYADDWTSTSKYVNCYNNYYDLITKYANIYGVDPKVALAIACHERGEHSNVIDSGGGLGLYQVQMEVWDGHDVRAFNFETNSWESYTIHANEVCNLEYNIKAGIMIFQECLRHDDYNVAMAVQEYNFGNGGLYKAINAASENLGVPRETLEQNGNTDWLDFRTYNKSKGGYQMGDPNYVENVFKYINNGEILKFRTPDNEIITLKYNNLNEQMKMN